MHYDQEYLATALLKTDLHLLFLIDILPTLISPILIGMYCVHGALGSEPAETSTRPVKVPTYHTKHYHPVYKVMQGITAQHSTFAFFFYLST